jgi:hypothetical protein
LDAQLVDHVGRGITIAGTVRALGTLCTDKACVRACCNRCDTPLGLYNRADRVALIVAECSGDECLECCTLPVVNQRIRASGVLTGYSPIGELDLAEAVASTPPGPDRLAEVFARAGGDNPSGSGETFTFMLRLQDVCVEP